MGHRKYLPRHHPYRIHNFFFMVTSNRTYIPAACYTLSREEKYQFCKTLFEIKVPEEYKLSLPLTWIPKGEHNEGR